MDISIDKYESTKSYMYVVKRKKKIFKYIYELNRDHVRVI